MSETRIKVEIENDTPTRIESNLQTASRSNRRSVSAGEQHSNELQSLDGTHDNGENVNAVVTKAKRAAIFLWDLLHAQLCTSSVDSCPHQCCENAKRIHLHIKTCPATSDIACPTSHPGCQQARKLLIHYRKCKEMRTRQRRQARHAQQIKSCLICTLLARHDKGISENFSSLRISSPLPITPHKTNRRTKARSKSVQFDLTPGIKEKAKASYRPGAMPPPPPRSTLSRIVPLKNSYHPFRLKDGNRPRSGSLDERRLPSDMGNDPTVELELRATASDDPLQLKPVQRQLPFRKRSVSCSLLPNEKPADCDTIMEE